MESKKKTLYELDLEVVYRRPDIIPSVGDWVKIKSRDWYEKWKDSAGYVYNVGLHSFTYPMVSCCERVYKVKKICGTYYCLEGTPYKWTLQMFEQVYLQEEYNVYRSYSEDFVVPIEKNATAMEAKELSDVLSALSRPLSLNGIKPSSSIIGVGSTQGIGTTDWWNGIFDGNATGFTYPRFEFSNPHTQEDKDRLREKWLPKKEPKLKIIKTNQLIKVEKL